MVTRPKILLVTKNVPYPAMAGSNQRTSNLIDALNQIGDVSLFIIGPVDCKPFLESAGYRVAATAECAAQGRSITGRALQRFFPNKGENIWRTLAGVKVDFTTDPGLNETLVQVLAKEHFDLIVGRYLIPTAQSGILELRYPVIIDVDDVDSKVVAGKIRSPASGILLRTVLKFRWAEVQRYEKQLWAKAARLWFSNPDDLSLTYGMKADVIPNIPYVVPSRKDLEHSHADSKVILMVGSFNHRVNLEGVDLFLRRAWENIRRVNPDVCFRIVGSHLPDAIRKKWMVMPGVDVIGYAESLRPHYADAAFSIVPLMDGAGTKIKVLESLAYLRTCVVTTHSIAGFESLLRDGDSVRVAASFKDMPQIISELLNQPPIRHVMEDSGRTIIEKHFVKEALRYEVRQSLKRLPGGIGCD